MPIEKFTASDPRGKIIGTIFAKTFQSTRNFDNTPKPHSDQNRHKGLKHQNSVQPYHQQIYLDPTVLVSLHLKKILKGCPNLKAAKPRPPHHILHITNYKILHSLRPMSRNLVSTTLYQETAIVTHSGDFAHYYLMGVKIQANCAHKAFVRNSTTPSCGRLHLFYQHYYMYKCTAPLDK